MSRVLDKTGVMVRDREMIYKTVVRTVIFYSRESWVITGAIMKVLEDFHHRIISKIMGKTAHHVGKQG